MGLLHRFSAQVASVTAAFICCLSLVFVEPCAAQDNKPLTVKVRDSKLRAEPKLWAKSLADLKFGDVLTPISAENGWFKVKSKGGVQGFVHPTAVTDRKVVLASSKTAAANVDASEVVLAGKGFNKEIEKDFAANNPGSDFRQVDLVGSVKIPDAELVRFMKEGKLGKGQI